MNRRNFFTQLFVTALALFAVSLPALAQAKTADRAAGILRIHEVKKQDAAAQLVGKKRLVPVSVKMELAELVDQAKLQSVRVELVTLNTDGTQTRISQVFEHIGELVSMKLPMPDGVFAKSFTLNAVADVLRNGKKEILRASKSGNF